MAKKTRAKVTVGGDAPARGGKSAAIREYMAAHKNAMPKEIVAALKEKGIEVSPNLVSILRAKAKVKGAKKKAKAGGDEVGNGSPAGNAAALDAALTLYKAARSSADGSNSKVRQAFLLLVETFG